MKTTLVIVAMTVIGLVSCESTGSTTDEVEVCDSTAVGHIDSIQSDCITITDVSVTADSTQ